MSGRACCQCGHALRTEWKLCPYCGSPATSSCEGCGAQTESGWKVCPFCGTALNAAAVSRPAEQKPSRPVPQEKRSVAPKTPGGLKPTRGNAVTTWHLAREVGAGAGSGNPLPVETVFKVFDGFRSYVLNPAHYRMNGGLKLVIPNFGRFMLHRRRAGKGVLPFNGLRYRVREGYRLAFRLSSRAEASHFEGRSTEWIAMASNVDPATLSVQRRIALFVSEEEGLELETVDRVLSETYRQILDLLLRKRFGVTFYKLGRFDSPRTFRMSGHALGVLADAGRAA